MARLGWLVPLAIAMFGLRPSFCDALLTCTGSPESCGELQNQRCEDTDGDGEADTCLCLPGLYLRITTCHVLPTGQGEAPVSPCVDNSPCMNGGECVYNQTVRHVDCICPPGFRGQRCELEAVVCSRGEYLDKQTDSCPYCPIGSYKPQDGPQACTSCGPTADGIRQITPREGSTRKQECTPGPSVEKFVARYGPIAGGTVVNVTLREVTGYTISKVKGISVAEAACNIQNSSDLAANEMQCVTSPVTGAHSGPVVLRINGLDFKSDQKFEYRDNPILTEINGTKTFIKGGRIIKIFGEHLDSIYAPIMTITLVESGVKPEEAIAKSRCAVLSSNVMACPTPNLYGLTEIINPQEARREEKTSAATQTTVSSGAPGTLTSTPTPPIKEGPIQESPIQKSPIQEGPIHETPVNDPGPTQEDQTGERPRESPEGRRRKRDTETPHYGSLNTKKYTFWLGFELDGVDRYRNVSQVLPFGEIMVYKDPKLDRFTKDPQQIYYHDYEFYNGALAINGEWLDLGASIEDYIVEIGQGFCNVTYLSLNSLHCMLPPVLPLPKVDRIGGPTNVPRMQVTVGNLRFDLGFISYKSQASPEIILGIVIAVILIILIIIGVVIFVLRRRSRKGKNANLQTLATLDPNIYTETGARGLPKGRTRNGYLQPVHHVNGYDGTPRPSLTSHISGNSLTPLMIPMPDSRSLSQAFPGYYLDGSGTPTTPTTPNMADNVAYQIPRHNSIPFEIMDAISEDLRLLIEECRVDSRRLTLQDSIGKGFFGKVYRGTLLDESGKSETTVAIKTIQGKECMVKDVEAFLAEAIVMKDCHNDNVLSLLGVVIAGNRPFAILPFMEYGDLKSYIADPERSIKVRELLGFGVQVSAGMEYLASQKIVHRDLATRNCMINKELTVRIADFGLSRDIYKSDYYRVEDKHRPLPVKWMAIESLTGGVFSSSSDVWSFGVLLWELLTRGCPPYPDIDTFNLKNYLLSGRRLPQPEHAPDEVYGIMSSCWLERPDDRCTFSQLREILSRIVEEDEENMTPEYLKLI